MTEPAIQPGPGLSGWWDDVQEQSGAPWYEEVLPLAEIGVYSLDEDGGYQRRLDELHVRRIVAKWDAGEARAIYVSKREDDSMWALDGQHTMAVLQHHGITHWMCRVFLDLSPQEEARRFKEYQENSKRLDPITHWNADVVAGDEVTNRIEEILAEHYLRIGTSTLRQREGYLPLKCLNAFETIWALGESPRGDDLSGRGGENVLRWTLTALAGAFGHSANTYQSRVIVGMGFLFAKVTPHRSWEQECPLDMERLIHVLRKTTSPLEVVDLIRKLGEGGGSAPARGGEVLLKMYVGRVDGDEPLPAINAKVAPKLPERKTRRRPQPK